MLGRKDNDRDGITDWMFEPGCTSARDVRESSQFSCAVKLGDRERPAGAVGLVLGHVLRGRVLLLDGVQLNGRYDVKHAPSCSPPTLTRVRCKTKNGAQNPGRLVDARFATTSKDPLQRVQLRFFDLRKRQIGRFVVPPLVVPQTS